MIEPENKTISIRRQCELLDISRSTVYRKPGESKSKDFHLMNKIDEIYTRRPIFGSRRMRLELLNRHETRANRKRIQRLMRQMGLVAIYPKPNLSRRNTEHRIYPYLLRDLPITRPNQVWASDITYIRLEGGFVYLTTVMDWYSRRVLSWRLSNTLDTSFCVEALEEALQRHGRPEIFNTDQGSQFTGDAFTNVLKEHEIHISMDGKGRALDNVFVERLWRSVKYEDVYLNDYASMKEAKEGLKKYFSFYNEQRFHQGLDGRTPDQVYYNQPTELCAA